MGESLALRQNEKEKMEIFMKREAVEMIFLNVIRSKSLNGEGRLAKEFKVK